MIKLFFMSLFIVILIHELSHFIVAKLLKCKVLIFSLGLGKSIYQKKYKETIYQIAILPIGGFCALKDELNFSKDKQSFSNLPYFKKFLISIAGCFSNIIIGILFLFLGKWSLNPNLKFFGILSISLGVANLIPIAPCLDGGYIIYMPIFLRVFGKEKGIKLFSKICQISLKILMTVDISFLILILVTGYYKVIFKNLLLIIQII